MSFKRLKRKIRKKNLTPMNNRKKVGVILFATSIGLITQKNQEKTSLVQEKNELSRTERIKKIAEEKGLSINDDNLRKVK